MFLKFCCGSDVRLTPEIALPEPYFFGVFGGDRLEYSKLILNLMSTAKKEKNTCPEFFNSKKHEMLRYLRLVPGCLVSSLL